MARAGGSDPPRIEPRRSKRGEGRVGAVPPVQIAGGPTRTGRAPSLGAAKKSWHIPEHPGDHGGVPNGPAAGRSRMNQPTAPDTKTVGLSTVPKPQEAVGGGQMPNRRRELCLTRVKEPSAVGSGARCAAGYARPRCPAWISRRGGDEGPRRGEVHGSRDDRADGRCRVLVATPRCGSSCHERRGGRVFGRRKTRS